MKSFSRFVLVLIFIVGNWASIQNSVQGQGTQLPEEMESYEYPDFTLSFQYIEGPNLTLPKKKSDPKIPCVISAKEREAWLNQIKKEPGNRVMENPIGKHHKLGQLLRDFFGVETGIQLLANYQLNSKEGKDGIELDLAIGIHFQERTSEFGAHIKAKLTPDQTLIIESQQNPLKPRGYLLVNASKRPKPTERVIHLEIRQIENPNIPSPSSIWNPFLVQNQSGVSEKELNQWFMANGTTLEECSTQVSMKSMKNTESLTVQNWKQKTPTDLHPEIFSTLTEFFIFNKIKMIHFTEKDLTTFHHSHFRLLPDVTNENSPFRFLLNIELSEFRGDRPGHGGGTTIRPKPGNYLVIDSTKPKDPHWKMLLIRMVPETE